MNNSKSILYFRPGKMEGFTSAVDKPGSGYATPIRELLQNSLDASVEAGNRACKVNIYIEDIVLTDIPHIDEYKKVLGSAIETLKKKEAYNDASRQRAELMQEELKKISAKVLVCVDNGAGMSQEALRSLLEGRSFHKGKESSGSYGVGHKASYDLSKLNYVLYATKYKDKNNEIKSLYTGSPILAGHEDDNAERNARGQILKEIPKNENKPQYIFPSEFPTFIKSKMDKLKTGSMVAILGLEEDWGDKAEYAIASNFFHAIARGELEVKIYAQKCPSIEITPKKVGELLEKEKEKEKKRKRNDMVLTGDEAHKAWRTIASDDRKKNITLPNKDEVDVYIENNAEDTDSSTIVLIRNGMVVARHDCMTPAIANLRNDVNFLCFTAVIDVDNNKAPEMFRLVKRAETSHHNQLVTKNLSKHDKKELDNIFEELSKEIKKHLEKDDREIFNVPLFPTTGLNEAQTIHSKGSGQSTKGKAEVKPKPPKPKPPEARATSRKSARPEPIHINRNLECENSVRYSDSGDKWVVQLRISPDKYDVQDTTYLSICLAEDNDNSNNFLYCEIIAVEIEGEKLNEIDRCNTQVKLGALTNQTYNISVEVKKPKNIGNMKVALQPILGLKRM